MTDPYQTARTLAQKLEWFRNDRICETDIAEIAAALREQYAKGFADAAHDCTADAEGYERARKDLNTIHSAKWSKEDEERGYRRGYIDGFHEQLSGLPLEAQLDIKKFQRGQQAERSRTKGSEGEK